MSVDHKVHFLRIRQKFGENDIIYLVITICLGTVVINFVLRKIASCFFYDPIGKTLVDIGELPRK